ncbi:MAG: hypothetical protein PHT83_02880 [Bacilli bacterium]|nr:hypothetical protein [Bacilli bacterium]
MIKLKTKYDFRTIKYFNLFNFKYSKKIYIWYLVMAAFALGALVYSLFFMQGNLLAYITGASAEVNYLFPIIFVLIAVYLVWQVFNMEKRLDTQLVRMMTNRKPAEFVIEVDQDELRIFDAEKTDAEPAAKYPWAYITAISEIPEYYFLMAGKQPIIIDRREEMIIDGSKEELDLLIKETSIAKPYKRFDNFIVKGKTELQYVAPVVVEEASKEEEKTEEVSSEEKGIEEVIIPTAVIEDTEIKDTEIEDTEIKDIEIKDIEIKDIEIEDAEIKESEEVVVEKPAVKKSSTSTAKKPAAKKATSTAKKPAAKKSTTSTAKKPAAKKATSSTAKKPATKKSTTSTAKKPAAKKTTTSTAKKTTTTTKKPTTPKASE